MFEITWFVIAAILLPFVLRNIFAHASVLQWGAIFLGGILGIIFSDFTSGVVHWAADTWGSLEVPLVGPTFIRSFREHHLSPTAMCDHDIIEANGDTVMIILPVLAFLGYKNMLANSSDGIHTSSRDLLFSSFWLMLSVGTALTNQFHKWAHMNKPPRVVEFLQSWWIILPKRIHNPHHRPPFDVNYCITTGWLNPFLTTIRFWRGAEAVISFFTGWIPREDDYKWTGISEGVPDVVAKYINEKRAAKEEATIR